MTVLQLDARNAVAREDVLMRTGRGLLYTSLFLSSLLVARVGDYTAGDLVLAAAVAVTGFAVAVQTTAARTRTLPVVAMLVGSLIVAGGTLSGLRAQSVTSTLAVVARLLLVVLVLPWLARVLLPSRRHLRNALTAFVAGCGLCGAGTIVQFVFGESVIPNTGVTNAGRFAGLTQNVSDTGGICCVGVVAAIALAATAASGRARVVPLLALIGSLFGLLLSGSVSGLLSAAIGFAVLGFAKVLRPRAIIGAVTGFVLVLVLSVAIQTESGALNPVQRILQTTGQSAGGRYDTAGSRLSTYTEALRKFFENPLIGNGLDPNSTIADGIYPAHNLFLAAAFEGGVLLALGVLVAVLRPFLGGGVRGLRRDPLLAVGLALVLTELVFAMTAPSLYNRYFWIPVTLLLVGVALGEQDRMRPGAIPTARNAPASHSSVRNGERSFSRAGDPVPPRSGSRHS